MIEAHLYLEEPGLLEVDFLQTFLLLFLLVVGNCFCCRDVRQDLEVQMVGAQESVNTVYSSETGMTSCLSFLPLPRHCSWVTNELSSTTLTEIFTGKGYLEIDCFFLLSLENLHSSLFEFANLKQVT